MTVLQLHDFKSFHNPMHITFTPSCSNALTQMLWTRVVSVDTSAGWMKNWLSDGRTYYHSDKNYLLLRNFLWWLKEILGIEPCMLLEGEEVSEKLCRYHNHAIKQWCTRWSSTLSLCLWVTIGRSPNNSQIKSPVGHWTLIWTYDITDRTCPPGQ